MPSLDTPVCALSTKKFNEFATQHDDVVMLMITADLPFAQKRFCVEQGIENVVPLAMMRSKNFAKDYGVLIQDGVFEGISARAVVVLNAEDKVIHAELVPDTSQEPDYEAALTALSNCIK